MVYIHANRNHDSASLHHATQFAPSSFWKHSVRVTLCVSTFILSAYAEHRPLNAGTGAHSLTYHTHRYNTQT